MLLMLPSSHSRIQLQCQVQKVAGTCHDEAAAESALYECRDVSKEVSTPVEWVKELQIEFLDGSNQQTQVSHPLSHIASQHWLCPLLIVNG